MEELKSFVVVNGVEVNETPLTEEEAANLSLQYRTAGYTDVYVVDKESE